MSTRSAIIIENTDGTASGIYCHFDGYLEHHAPILLEHYGDESKARELVGLGDISSLRANVGEKHEFGRGETTDACDVYGRDRGETGVETKAGATWRAVAERVGHNGYIYVFSASRGVWMFAKKESAELATLEDVYADLLAKYAAEDASRKAQP